MYEVPVIRLDLPDGNWVDITAYQTEGEFEDLVDMMGTMSAAIEDGKPSMERTNLEIKLSAGRKHTLARRIKAWSYDCEVCEESIAGIFPRKYGDLVMEKIGELDGDDDPGNETAESSI